MQEFTVRPQPDDPRLTRAVTGIDHEGRSIETAVVMERPLTLFLNGREIVTMMTIGDHPDYLAVGYLLNQNMLRPENRITGIDYDDELETVVVRTDRETDFEDKLKRFAPQCAMARTRAWTSETWRRRSKTWGNR